MDFAEAHLGIPVGQKLEKLLKLIADRSDYLGSKILIQSEVFPLLDTENRRELVFLINQLKDSGYISGRAGAEDQVCLSTGKGWERIERQVIGGIPGRFFVETSNLVDLSESVIFYDGLRLSI